MKRTNKDITFKERNEYFNYKMRDLFFFILLTVIWAAVQTLGNNLLGVRGFIILFMVMVFFATFAVFFVRKIGCFFIVCMLGVTLIPSLPDLAGLGIKRYIIMSAIGIFFEITYLIFYKLINIDPLSIILSSSLSFATMPIWTGLSLSIYLMQLRRVELLNLVFLDALLAFLAAALAFLFWFYIRTFPFVLKYEYQ